MNKTVVIFFGLALLFHVAFSQAEASAQSQVSTRRNHNLREVLIASAEFGKGRQLDESEVDPKMDAESEPDRPPKESDEQDWQPSEVESFSPRAVLDVSTTERTPELTGTREASWEIEQADARVAKAVVIAGDQFFHRTIPFEEPLHERFGISHAPPVQLAKSTLVFFGKSLVLPANLSPRRHSERDCDSNEGWREIQGRQACPQCE